MSFCAASFFRAPRFVRRHSEELSADTNVSSLLGNGLWMHRQVKSLQRKVRREVNKYVFEVGDMNKQKLSEAGREKKGEKGNSGQFSHKRGERKQTKEHMGEEAEKE